MTPPRLARWTGSAALATALLTLCACSGGSSGGGGGSAPVTSGGGGGGTAPSTSGGIVSDHELNLTAGTFLGVSGDTARAVAFSGDGTLLVALNMSRPPAGIRVLGPGPGVVLRFRVDGQVLLGGALAGGTISDMALTSDGRVALVGAGFTQFLSRSLDQELWGIAQGGTRVAVSGTDTIGVLNQGAVTLYTGVGVAEQTVSGPGGAQLDDLAISEPSNRLVVTGFRQAASNLKVPILTAYDISANPATVAWQVYDPSASAAQALNLGADSEGARVAIGADNRLYFAGRTDGGNTVFSRLPNDITQTAVQNYTPNVFQQPVNLSGSAKFVYLARLDASTGSLVRGTFLLPRLQSGAQNTITALGLSASGGGEVLLTGHTRFAVREPDAVTVSGTKTTEAGAYACLFSANFDIRTWVTFASADTGDAVAAAQNGTRAAVLIDQASSATVTVQPAQATPGPGWLGVFPTQ